MWSVMNSMREIDTNSVIAISLNNPISVNNENETEEQE